MPILGLFVLFLVLPVAELYVILKVGDSIGVWWTLLLLAADSLIGTLLLRSQGRTVWRRFNAAMAEGRLPHREVMDGVLVIFGGAFLITPGFITDIVGVLLLLPPSRGRDQGDRGPQDHPARRRGCGRSPGGPAARAAPTTWTGRPPSTSPRRDGSSGERARARRRLLRPRPRDLRDRAVGRHGAVRGAQAHSGAGGPPGGARGRRLAGRAAGPPLARVRARLPRRPSWGCSPPHVCVVRGEAGGRRVDGPGNGGRDATARPPGRSSTPSAACRRSPTRATPCSRWPGAPAARPATARRTCTPSCSTRGTCCRSRTPASPPSTTAAGASAAPASSCG